MKPRTTITIEVKVDFAAITKWLVLLLVLIS